MNQPFIFDIKRIESYKKYSFSYYNFDYLRVWLNSHLTKYPGGILPKLPVSFTYQDDRAKHTCNFDDGNDPRNLKYIKSIFVILRTLKKEIERTALFYRIQRAIAD